MCRPVTTHVSFESIVISLVLLAAEPPNVGPVVVILRMCSTGVETSWFNRLLITLEKAAIVPRPDTGTLVS